MSDFDYDEYERKCNEIIKENEIYLKLFEEELKDLKPKTIRRHISNVDLYINEFLLREGPGRITEGPNRIYDFLGWHCIKTGVCSSADSMRKMGTSIKKFYQCMADHGYIEQEAYEDLHDAIKYSMSDWIDDCESYYDFSY